MAFLAAPMTVLQPSKISGVGCFSTLDIPKGDELMHLYIGEKSVYVEQELMGDLFVAHPELEHWVRRFCTQQRNGWMVPKNFECMDNTRWINHSSEPSLEYKIREGVWHPVALVDIVAFETELSYDYQATEGSSIAVGPERPPR